MMRALLIINPVSGDNESNTAKIGAIKKALLDAPFDLAVACTTPEKSTSEIAREAVRDGIEVVLVGGGDGTVSEVARELILTETALGIIPIGTFNNIARSLDIPAEIDAACGIVAQNHVKKFDVAQANASHVFFEAAGAGLDAALFPLGEEIKGGHWSRWLQFFRMAFQYQAPRFRITFDCTLAEALPPGCRKGYSARVLRSHVLQRRSLFVVASNGPYYGSGFTVAPGARMNDGKLTLSLYRNFSKWELFRHFQSISQGKRRYSSKIETFSASEIRLDGPVAEPVHLDGQPFGSTPVTLRTLPGALRVLVAAR